MPRRHAHLQAAPNKLSHGQRTRILARWRRQDVVVAVEVAVAQERVVGGADLRAVSTETWTSATLFSNCGVDPSSPKAVEKADRCLPPQDNKTPPRYHPACPHTTTRGCPSRTRCRCWPACSSPMMSKATGRGETRFRPFEGRNSNFKSNSRWM